MSCSYCCGSILSHLRCTVWKAAETDGAIGLSNGRPIRAFRAYNKSRNRRCGLPICTTLSSLMTRYQSSGLALLFRARRRCKVKLKRAGAW